MISSSDCPMEGRCWNIFMNVRGSVACISAAPGYGFLRNAFDEFPQASVMRYCTHHEYENGWEPVRSKSTIYFDGRTRVLRQDSCREEGCGSIQREKGRRCLTDIGSSVCSVSTSADTLCPSPSSSLCRLLPLPAADRERDSARCCSTSTGKEKRCGPWCTGALQPLRSQQLTALLKPFVVSHVSGGAH